MEWLYTTDWEVFFTLLFFAYAVAVLLFEVAKVETAPARAALKELLLKKE
jgi:hypothetical protein